MIQVKTSIFNRFDTQRMFYVVIEGQEHVVTLGKPITTAIRMIETFGKDRFQQALEVLLQDDEKLAKEVVMVTGTEEFRKEYDSYIQERLAIQAKEMERNRFNPSFVKTNKECKTEDFNDVFVEGLKRCVGL